LDFRLSPKRAQSDVFENCQSGLPAAGGAKGDQGKDSGLGMAREVAIDAFRQKTFATALTATGKGGAPAFGPHARPKTVLLLSRALGSL
jgi:hypothetical protein